MFSRVPFKTSYVCFLYYRLNTYRVSAFLDAEEDFLLKLWQLVVRPIVSLHLPANLWGEKGFITNSTQVLSL